MIAALLALILVAANVGLPAWLIARDLDADNKLDNRF